jgi:two-component system, OmpR family, response regulator
MWTQIEKIAEVTNIPQEVGAELARRGDNSTCAVDSNLSHILLIEDDVAMRRLVANFFEGHNIPVWAVSGRHELRQHLACRNTSLIILDLRRGGDDGLALLREIRSCSDVPIIVTTGDRCDEIDRVVALELGADDYVTKPFSLRELLARVRAVLRRQKIGRVARTRDPERGGFSFGGWQLERRARRLLDPKGNPVLLTKGEYVLLVAFLEAPQLPLSRDRLLQATRVHEDVFDRSIDVQVLRLRRKLETDPRAPRIIKTERGFGYIFALRVDRF